MRPVTAKAVERLREPLPQAANVARVLAKDRGCELGVDNRHRGCGGGMAERLAPAFKSLIGDDAQPYGVHRLPIQPARCRGFAAHIKWDARPACLDRRDLHRRSPVSHRASRDDRSWRPAGQDAGRVWNSRRHHDEPLYSAWQIAISVRSTGERARTKSLLSTLTACPGRIP